MGYYSEVAFEIAFPDAHDWDSHQQSIDELNDVFGGE